MSAVVRHCRVRQSDNRLSRDDTKQREPRCSNVEHYAARDRPDVYISVTRWHLVQRYFDHLAVEIGLQRKAARARTAPRR